MDYINVSKDTAYTRLHSLEDLGLIKKEENISLCTLFLIIIHT